MKIEVRQVVKYGLEVFEVLVDYRVHSTFFSKEMAVTKFLEIQNKLGV